MFEEPLASSSKDDPDKDLGIDYGEKLIVKDVSTSSNAIQDQEKGYSQKEDKSKS